MALLAHDLAIERRSMALSAHDRVIERRWPRARLKSHAHERTGGTGHLRDAARGRSKLAHRLQQETRNGRANGHSAWRGAVVARSRPLSTRWRR
jgi:hypothetical protein